MDLTLIPVAGTWGSLPLLLWFIFFFFLLLRFDVKNTFSLVLPEDIFGVYSVTAKSTVLHLHASNKNPDPTTKRPSLFITVLFCMSVVRILNILEHSWTFLLLWLEFCLVSLNIPPCVQSLLVVTWSRTNARSALKRLTWAKCSLHLLGVMLASTIKATPSIPSNIM